MQRKQDDVGILAGFAHYDADGFVHRLIDLTEGSGRGRIVSVGVRIRPERVAAAVRFAEGGDEEIPWPFAHEPRRDPSLQCRGCNDAVAIAFELGPGLVDRDLESHRRETEFAADAATELRVVRPEISDVVVRAPIHDLHDIRRRTGKYEGDIECRDPQTSLAQITPERPARQPISRHAPDAHLAGIPLHVVVDAVIGGVRTGAEARPHGAGQSLSLEITDDAVLQYPRDVRNQAGVLSDEPAIGRVQTYQHQSACGRHAVRSVSAICRCDATVAHLVERRRHRQDHQPPSSHRSSHSSSQREIR